MPTVAEISSFLHDCFPPHWAEPWDNSGLTVGSASETVDRVLIALDVTQATVAEAGKRRCQLLLTHHPFPWHERRRFDLEQPEPRLLREVVTQGLNLLAIHTNLDAAPNGHAAWIGEKLGLKRMRPLRPARERLVKTVFFVPPADAHKIREAITSAGAGRIGAYSACTFTSSGTGRFKPGEGSNPTVGLRNVENSEPEERIEAVCPAAIWPRVVEAARAVHPYETMAYDVLPEACDEPQVGLGRLGSLDSTKAERIVRRLAQIIPSARIQVAGDLEQPIELVAVCPGAAGDLLADAVATGVQLMIGAEFTHHQARTALDNRIVLVDPGHYATERPALDILAGLCADRFGEDLEVLISTEDADPLCPAEIALPSRGFPGRMQ